MKILNNLPAALFAIFLFFILGCSNDNENTSSNFDLAEVQNFYSNVDIDFDQELYSKRDSCRLKLYFDSSYVGNVNQIDLMLNCWVNDLPSLQHFKEIRLDFGLKSDKQGELFSKHFNSDEIRKLKNGFDENIVYHKSVQYLISNFKLRDVFILNSSLKGLQQNFPKFYKGDFTGFLYFFTRTEDEIDKNKTLSSLIKPKDSMRFLLAYLKTSGEYDKIETHLKNIWNINFDEELLIKDIGME